MMNHPASFCWSKFAAALGASAIAWALVFAPPPTRAQVPVITQPSVGNSANASGTIASTNTWQVIWNAATILSPRRGCIVVNNATHEEWVYFQGPTDAAPSGSASEALAIPLNVATANNAAGGSLNCTIGGVVLQDKVWITGTSGDTFVAEQQ